jgi:hypothetical protein
MTNFFKNPKASSVVVERVPCSFAKASHGKIGTHYTVVIFDENKKLMYVGSECEHKHGEAVQAMHEMGGTTCFSVTARFRAALNEATSSQKSLTHLRHNREYKKLENCPLLNAAFEVVHDTMVLTHNKRWMEKTPRSKFVHFPVKGPALQQIADKLTSKMMSLPEIAFRGNYANRLDPGYAAGKVDTLRPRVFHFSEFTVANSLEFSTEILSPGNYLMLSSHETPSEYDALAVRKPNGQWLVDRERVWSFARNSWNPLQDTRQWGISHNRCIYCGETYHRMSRHVQGARHKERVLELINMVCRATSPTGLRMINNPHHRSVFFR